MENSEEKRKANSNTDEEEPQSKKVKIEEEQPQKNYEPTEQQLNVLMRERSLKVWLSALNLPAKVQLLER